jgi:hypothetical protein
MIGRQDFIALTIYREDVTVNRRASAYRGYLSLELSAPDNPVRKLAAGSSGFSRS